MTPPLPATGNQPLADDATPIRVSWIGAFKWRMRSAPTVVMDQGPRVALNVEHDALTVRVGLTPARARELAHALVTAADTAEAAPPGEELSPPPPTEIDPPEVR